MFLFIFDLITSFKIVNRYKMYYEDDILHEYDFRF